MWEETHSVNYLSVGGRCVRDHAGLVPRRVEGAFRFVQHGKVGLVAKHAGSDTPQRQRRARSLAKYGRGILGQHGLPSFSECIHIGPTFVCMHWKRIGDFYSADAVSREGIGNVPLRLLTGGGASLERALADVAISEGPVASSTWIVCQENLAGMCGAHTIVLHGDFPHRYWPSYFHMAVGGAAQHLCTRPAFGQRAECKYHCFVQALYGRMSLEGCPWRRRKKAALRSDRRPAARPRARSAFDSGSGRKAEMHASAWTHVVCVPSRNGAPMS